MDHFVFSFVFVAHPRALLHDTTYLSKCQYLFEKFFNFFEIFFKDEKQGKNGFFAVRFFDAPSHVILSEQKAFGVL